MKETYLFDMSFNNVIFAHRNKDFGAYTLRREYSKHITTAACFAILTFSAALAWPLLLPKEPVQATVKKGEGTTVILIDKPHILPPVEPEPQAKAIPVSEQKIKTVKSTTIKVVADNHPGPDETPPTQSQLVGALIGTQNIDGELVTQALPEGIEGTEGNSTEGNGAAENTSVLDFAEEMPYFEGGETGLMAYIGKKIKYPRTAINAQIEGIVIVSFVVNRNGKVTDATILKGLEYGTEEEALRVINNMPAWTPGKQNGKPVAVRYTLPIRFNLQR